MAQHCKVSNRYSSGSTGETLTRAVTVNTANRGVVCTERTSFAVGA